MGRADARTDRGRRDDTSVLAKFDARTCMQKIAMMSCRREEEEEEEFYASILQQERSRDYSGMLRRPAQSPACPAAESQFHRAYGRTAAWS